METTFNGFQITLTCDPLNRLQVKMKGFDTRVLKHHEVTNGDLKSCFDRAVKSAKKALKPMASKKPRFIHDWETWRTFQDLFGSNCLNA